MSIAYTTSPTINPMIMELATVEKIAFNAFHLNT